MNPMTMSEREIIEDSLSTQKEMAGAYNCCAGNCGSGQLRATFLSILTEEQELGAEMLDELCARGWCKLQEATQSDITKAKQKFVSGQN